MEFTKLEDGKYRLEDGRTVTRAEVIRELFKQDWKRADIAKELEIPYNVVFQATANMVNAHHGPGRAGSVAAKMVELPDGTKIPRTEYIRQQVAAGRSKAEIAKELGVSNSVVWNATKDMEGVSGVGRHFVELPDGTKIPRNEYIRKRFAEGATRREIANELGCDYTIVWQATRAISEKSDEPAAEVEDAGDQNESKVEKGKGKVKTQANVNDEVNFPE